MKARISGRQKKPGTQYKLSCDKISQGCLKHAPENIFGEVI